MKTIFTICSNNYLAQAKTLGDSVLKYAKDYKFIIILCDKFSECIDYSIYKNFKLIEAQNLGIKNFNNMVEDYDIVELNTSIKPFSFQYIYDNFNSDTVIYLDPDTCLFNSLDIIDSDLKDSDMVLTPHICTPINDDGLYPQENLFTNYGMFNLGFLATKKSNETKKMLSWWKERLTKNCKNDVANGTFVDQLPMNYTPLFFKNVKINTNPGLNAAPWNIHERKLKLINGKYFINNNKAPLVFWHFSSYNPSTPEQLSKWYTRMEQYKDECLINFYNSYMQSLFSNNWKRLYKIPCAYNKKHKPGQNKKITGKILNYFKILRCIK